MRKEARFSILLCLTFGLLPLASADLGRTKLDYWGEYGIPINRFVTDDKYEGYQFGDRAQTETVLFYRGQCIGFILAKLNHKPFSEIEIAEALQRNASDSRWEKEKTEVPEQAEGEASVWQRKDGDGYATYFHGKIKNADGSSSPVSMIMIGNRRGGKWFNRMLERGGQFELVPY